MIGEEYKVHFNSLLIIESLPIGEERTGYRLYEDLMHHQHMFNFPIEYVRVGSKIEFENQFTLLRNRFKEKFYPMLHFEVHGRKEGILPANEKQVIKWTYLCDFLAEINERMQNNLFVSFSTCEAYFVNNELLNRFFDKKRSPFAVMVGPSREMDQGSLRKWFSAFFPKFIESKDLNTAISATDSGNRIVHFGSARMMAVKILDNIDTNYTNNKSKEELLQLYISLPEHVKQTVTLPFLETQQKQLLFEHLEGLWNTYFMMDIFPHNSNRFGSLKQILEEMKGI